MSRYIDADALQKLFNEVSTSLLCRRELAKDTEHMVRAFIMVTEMIQDAPTVDAVEVVRCRDCKHHRTLLKRDMCAKNAVMLYECGSPLYRNEVGLKATRADDFCSYGERRADCGRT